MDITRRLWILDGNALLNRSTTACYRTVISIHNGQNHLFGSCRSVLFAIWNCFWAINAKALWLFSDIEIQLLFRCRFIIRFLWNSLEKAQNDLGLTAMLEFMLDFHASYASKILKTFDRMTASSLQQLKLFANASINISNVCWSRIILGILSYYIFLCKQNFLYWFSMDTRCSSGTKWKFIKLKLRTKRTTGNYVLGMERKNQFHQWFFQEVL